MCVCVCVCVCVSVCVCVCVTALMQQASAAQRILRPVIPERYRSICQQAIREPCGKSRPHLRVVRVAHGRRCFFSGHRVLVKLMRLPRAHPGTAQLLLEEACSKQVKSLEVEGGASNIEDEKLQIGRTKCD